MHAERSASLTNDELVQRINIDAVDFGTDCQGMGAIYDFPIMVGPVSIAHAGESLETDLVDIRHSKVRMQGCAEVERPRSRILDAQLQLEPNATYRHAQLAGEGMRPNLPCITGVFDTKRRAGIAFADVDTYDMPITGTCQAMVR